MRGRKGFSHVGFLLGVLSIKFLEKDETRNGKDKYDINLYYERRMLRLF